MSLVTLIRVRVTVSERWAISGMPLPRQLIDARVLKDPRTDTAYIPGGTLAGSLRRQLGDIAEHWLGPLPGPWEVPDAQRSSPGSSSAPAKREASRLGILGTLSHQGLVAVDRGSTAIDPKRGAAKASSLRTEQWRAPGSFVIAMEHDGPADPELIARLGDWRPILGKGRTKGMGQAHVSGGEAVTIDLADPSQLEWWLLHRHEWYAGSASPPAGIQPAPIDSAANRADPGWRWTLHWTTREPLHVGDHDQAEMRGDAHRTFTPMKNGDRVVVPGSSWKGVFRHRAQAILSILDGGPEGDGADEIIDRLFGTETRRGVIGFSDSTAAADAKLVTRTHVAIDRFTGGVRTGALFRVEALDEGAALDLTLTSPWPTMPASVLNLLAHIARDIDDGLVTVGRHGSRGYGQLTLADGDRITLSRVSIAELRDDIAGAVTAAKAPSDKEADRVDV